ncbi:MAG: kynureninase [Fimbriimonadaceae bacterium]|nr:kynureninase [Fimbriimonadaceae bacterium]
MTLDHARRLDAADPLASFRTRFLLPEGLTYLDGNSLGPLTISGRDALAAATERWSRRLIGGWNEDWIAMASRVAARLAPLLGALEEEVLIGSDTSTNLFRLAHAAAEIAPDRTDIVTDDLNFPSDRYVLEGIAKGLGRRVQVVRSTDGIHADEGAIMGEITDRTSFVCLSMVAYRTGYLYDVPTITDHAHRHGALVLWDLSHAAGVVPIHLDAWKVDLAVGCTYKYLNGGPGAPAYLYVRRDLQGRLRNPVQGWFGHADPFSMVEDYAPSPGVRRFSSGTPPILSLAPVDGGVQPTVEAGVARVREKSVALTIAFVEEVERILVSLGFSIQSPCDPARRGSHVSLGHPYALAVSRCLVAERAVVPDFRPPNVLRFGFAPLYNRFEDMVRAIEQTAEVVRTGAYEPYLAARPFVP